MTGSARLLQTSEVVLTCPVFVTAGQTLEIEPGSGLAVQPFSTPLSAVDTDSNGRATADELLTYMERLGAPPRTVASLLASLDVNSDCTIDAGEWAAMPSVNDSSAAAGRAYLVGSPLVIERGARLVASGSVDEPITFRAAGMNDSSAAPPGGGWGGLVLFGDAPVASADPPTGACWAGFGRRLAQSSPAFGGGNPADDSGVLRYVRVWHSQRGISLQGVGSGTVVERCESVGSATDGFVLHGGTVSLRQLSSIDAAHAGFRVRAGYSGDGQFLFAMLGTAGRYGVLSGAANGEEADDTYAASPALRPRFFSLTIIGGGAGGLTNSSLMRLESGTASGGAFGNAVLVHSSGSGIELHGEDAAQQAHPPPPSPSGVIYTAAAAYTHAVCGSQHADGVSEGIFLGTQRTAEECAQAAGGVWEASGNANCSHFQHSHTYPMVWGCLCCVQSAGGRPDPEWTVYQTVPTGGRRLQASAVPALYLSSLSVLVGHTAGEALVGPNGTSASLNATRINATGGAGESSADACFMNVQRDCLSTACLHAADRCADPFDPLPRAGGAACTAQLDDPSTAFGDASGFFRPVACAGAFASAHYEDNWLAGWSSAFPRRLGEDHQSAASMVVGTGVSTMRLDTSFLAANDTVVAARRTPVHAFDPSQCARSAFSPQVLPTEPVFWALVRARATGVATLHTCSGGEASFDTDVAVFRRVRLVTGNCTLEQVGCNGDGEWRAGCQRLYSSLPLSLEAGRSYLVAVKGHLGAIGAAVNLTAELMLPPAPPAAPSPSPPPRQPDLTETARIQQQIDAAPPEELVVMHVGASTILDSTIRIGPGRRVAIVGIETVDASVLRSVVSAPNASAFRLFDVGAGAALYLTRLVLRHGFAAAAGECGGGVRVQRGGSLVAQYTRFESNAAERGGAVCFEAEGRLQLLAVDLVGSSASGAGADIYLGRPFAPPAEVDLLGVCTGNGCPGVSAAYEPTIWHEGAWSTSSCLPGSACAFHPQADYTPALKAECAPAQAAGESAAFGASCQCLSANQLAFTTDQGTEALAPYATSPVEMMVGRLRDAQAEVYVPRCFDALQAAHR